MSAENGSDQRAVELAAAGAALATGFTGAGFFGFALGIGTPAAACVLAA